MAWAIVLATLAFFTLLPVAAMALAWGRFAWRLRHPYPAPQRLPDVAVVLSLRGADPSLEACLAGVLAQDYPAYQVHIVVDSAEDPALAVVANVLARGHAPNAAVHVDIRRDRSERCSLKLIAQRQVLSRLEEPVAVVVFLDADSVPSAGWLRAMAAPFADRRVGGATGVRWATPVESRSGTLARHVFNVLSFPQSYLYRIPWGGSLAVRKSAIHQAGLLDHCGAAAFARTPASTARCVPSGSASHSCPPRPKSITSRSNSPTPLISCCASSSACGCITSIGCVCWL